MYGRRIQTEHLPDYLLGLSLWSNCRVSPVLGLYFVAVYYPGLVSRLFTGLSLGRLPELPKAEENVVNAVGSAADAKIAGAGI